MEVRIIYGNFETIHHNIPENQSFFAGRSELLCDAFGPGTVLTLVPVESG